MKSKIEKTNIFIVEYSWQNSFVRQRANFGNHSEPLLALKHLSELNNDYHNLSKPP